MSRSEGSDLDAQYLLSHMKSRKCSSLGVAFRAPSCTLCPGLFRTGRMMWTVCFCCRRCRSCRRCRPLLSGLKISLPLPLPLPVLVLVLAPGRHQEMTDG